MHIGLDLTSLMRDRTGVDTAIRELVLALARVDQQNQYTIFLNQEDAAEFRALLPPSFRLLAWATRNRAVRGFVQQAAFPAACIRHSIDVLHSPSFLMPVIRGGARHLVTVHDLTFFTMPLLHSGLHQNCMFKQAVKWTAHRADLIQVPSEATRNELLELWPAIPEDRICIVPWGVASEFEPAEPNEICRHRLRLGLPKGFVLFAGTIEPRKNVDVLIEAYRRFIRDGDTDAHLVLVGRRGWNCESTLERLNAPELRGRTHYLGFVDQQDLPWIYRAAALFVYPSRYEGFGFPPLEAMACGVPVIASSGSALEANLEGAAELIEPGNSEMLAAAMQKLLRESAEARCTRVCAGLERARQFSWTRTAEMMLECYRELSESASGYRLRPQ